MAKGAIAKFADGAGLEGDPFAWIKPLTELSVPTFSYEKGHPLENIIFDISPYEISRVVDFALSTYSLDLKGNLKELERMNQRLAVDCMVNQAYIAGARDLLLEGIKLEVVTPVIAADVRQRIDEYWGKAWRLTAGAAAFILSKIEFHVKHKGKRGRPTRPEALGNPGTLVDSDLLNQIHNLAPAAIRANATDYSKFMNENLVENVKRFIREGKLAASADAYAYQTSVDNHAKRLRLRIQAHVDLWFGQVAI